MLVRQEDGGEQGFIFKYADPKYFKKVRLRILEGLAETWYMIKKVLKIPYHSSLAPIWNSLGSPEWTKDALAVPLLDAGITRWENIIQNGQLLSWEMCKQKLDSKVSRFKYLQVQSWFHASGTIIGERNELEDRLMLETVLKKELACTYWLMVGLEDGAFTLPLDLWGRCFPETELEHQWRVSMSMLYKIVKPTYLRRNHLFTLHRAYWTPQRLSKFGNRGEVACTKCGSKREDDVHMFVGCPDIQIFWKNVSKALSSMLEINIQVSVLLVMFGCLDSPIRTTKDQAKKKTLTHVLNLSAALLCSDQVQH